MSPALGARCRFAAKLDKHATHGSIVIFSQLVYIYSTQEVMMRVTKWGNSLAVRLPASVDEALVLKEGDDIDIQIAETHAFEIEKSRGLPSC